MNKTIPFAAACLALAAHAADPSIREGSVTMTQDPSSRQVLIQYELDNAPAIVTVDILTNGVSIGASNLKYFAGDVHRIVRPSGAKRITWRPDKAWPGHEITDQSVTAKVTAWALNAPPNIMVVDLVVPNQLDFYADVESLPGRDGVKNELYKTDKMVFRKCPAANVTWRMGAPSTDLGYASNRAATLVTLTNDFYMGVYALTQRQYERITAKASHAVAKNADQHAIRPMEHICWNELRMSDSTTGNADYDWPSQGHAVSPVSLLGRLRTHVGERVRFDLPLEAQWEFACRAGVGAELYTGKALSSADTCPEMDEIACYKNNNDGAPAPVGSYLPNAWGFYDMCGSVMEWCLDYYYDTRDGVDPETGAKLTEDGKILVKGTRAWRGGWYLDNAKSCSTAARLDWGQGHMQTEYTGCRIAAVAELIEP